MSEVSDQGQVAGQAGGAGALIRRAREDAGVHIAALAVALKVPVKRLEALEADRYDLLPDAVFARALAGSVCRNLKLDPGRVMPLLPNSRVQAPTVEGRINEPFRTAAQGPGSWLFQVSRPAVIGAGVLVVAAAAVYLLPLGGGSEPAGVSPAALPASGGAEPAPATAPLPAVAPGMVVESVSTPAASNPAPGLPFATQAPASR
jgi:cytoskeleton protein RodZ